jgi:hypothetical protein
MTDHANDDITAAAKSQGFPTWTKVCAGAAAVTLIAAFLPWVSVFGISVSGIHADGQVTSVVAAIGGLALLGRRWLRTTLIVQSLAAAIIAIVGIADMNSFAAMGLYLTFFAGIAWILGAVLGWRARRQPTPAQ